MRILNERNISMDMARIVASFMVVVLHVTAAWKYGSCDSLGWFESIVYDCLSRCAVPIFFMLSGAFFTAQYDKKKHAGKLCKYILIFLFASVIYTLSDYFYNIVIIKDMAFEVNIKADIFNYKYHLWYLPAYILVLTIAPVIVNAMSFDSEYQITKYMIALFLVFGVIPHTFRLIIMDNESLNYLATFTSIVPAFVSDNHIGYFVIGRYMYEKDIDRFKRKCLYGLGGALNNIAMYRYYCLQLA